MDKALLSWPKSSGSLWPRCFKRASALGSVNLGAKGVGANAYRSTLSFGTQTAAGRDARWILAFEGGHMMDHIHFDPAACESLEDYTALEYILLGDLRDLLEEPADQFTRRWLVAVLDALLDTLPREMALKESSGYLNEVLDEYPSWYRHVEDLQNEQRLLVLSLQALRDRLDSAGPYERDADRVNSTVRQWMNRLQAHRRHETRLLQTAMNLECGCGD
jgi:hypothetical protein